MRFVRPLRALKNLGRDFIQEAVGITVCLVLAAFIGAVVGALLVVTGGKAKKKPFISTAA